MADLTLDNVQSNILRYHNRDNARYVFIRFHGSAKDIKKWVSDFPNHFELSSAATGLEDYQNYKNGKQNNGLISSLHFSAYGFMKMGFFENDAGLPKDAAFWRGMRARGTLLNDPPEHLWETNYRNTVDAMLMLADNTMAGVEERMNQISQSLQKKNLGEILFFENAHSLTDKNGNKVEHFGYRDGLSQPVLWNKEELLEDKWNVVLENNGGGSYLIFRKLEQNVKLFQEKVTAIAKKYTGSKVAAGAHIIGRFKDGRLLEEKKNQKEKSKCPFSSHTQKMKASPFERNQKMIMRRGVPYDNRSDQSDPVPESGVGLLFLCYQASIEYQFEMLQSQWANNLNYPTKKTGIDPLIGQTPILANQVESNGTITLKGGEYFYAPGIPFLKNIMDYPKLDNYSSGGTSGYYGSGGEGFSYAFLRSLANVGRNSGYNSKEEDKKIPT